MPEPELKVVKLKTLITFSPGWRRPILHWKLRHLRRAIRDIERRQAGDLMVLMSDEIGRRMEEQMLYGSYGSDRT